MKPISHILKTLAAIAMMAFSSTAMAETINCTVITSLPFTINTQGVFCLKSKVSGNLASSSAILINVNNVTLDLNGFALGNLAAGPGTIATGIAVNGSNVTIRNGVVRGYKLGIAVLSTRRNILIEDVTIDVATIIGISSGGESTIVRNCNIKDTGGSTDPGQNNTAGISLRGNGSKAINNTITGVRPTTDVGLDSYHAIEVGANVEGALVQGNFIQVPQIHPGVSPIGVFVTSPGTKALVSDNHMSGGYIAAIFFDNATAPAATGVYAGNRVTGMGNILTPFAFVPALGSAEDGGGNFASF